MLPCSWKEYFGVECPTCGAQRSFLELISGNFLESIFLFPALIPFLAVVVLTILHLIHKRLVHPKWIVVLFSITVIVLLVSWIVKFF